MSMGRSWGAYALGENGGSLPELTDDPRVRAVFFGGKRVGIVGTNGVTTSFGQDRLGSAREFLSVWRSQGRCRPLTRSGFATYTRDSATGLDYADQRYYAYPISEDSCRPTPTDGGTKGPQGVKRRNPAKLEPLYVRPWRPDQLQ